MYQQISRHDATTLRIRPNLHDYPDLNVAFVAPLRETG
jgi:hypothetical protein